MSRPQTKEALTLLIVNNYDDLKGLIESSSLEEQESHFQFFKDDKLKEAHYKRDENLKDVLVHLYEWQCLLLSFIKALREDKNTQVSFLPVGYTWKTYPKMNQAIKEKHQKTTLEEAKRYLDDTHEKVLNEIECLTEESLFEKGHFKAIKNTTLLLYVTANTSSHYVFAYKKNKKHLKERKAHGIKE